MTAKELQRAYKREWRAKNKERIRKYNQNYWERKAARMQSDGKEGKTDAMAENQTRP